jgi:hypothetical protein
VIEWEIDMLLTDGLLDKGSLVKLAGACALALGSLGCGGIGPGDYVVYRIALQEPVRSDGCYANGQIPVNEQEDTSNQFVAGTWILYVGADDKAYLDLGSTTLQGDESGGTYTFAGQRTDVQYYDDGNGNIERTETRTVATDVTLNVDGKVVDGAMSSTENFQCSGNNCPEPVNCTTVTNFVGGEVKDVKLEHEV